MISMSLQEAQLFRMLEGLFGRDRVVWNMSTRSVCGGEYPTCGDEPAAAVARWAEAAGCMFTVVDADDSPKMVVELALDLSQPIDVALLERQQHLPKLLEQQGVQYVLIKQDEFAEILDPQGSLDLVSVLKDRFGIEQDDGDIQDEGL
jgi:hypothetical protein